MFPIGSKGLDLLSPGNCSLPLEIRRKKLTHVRSKSPAIFKIDPEHRGNAGL